MKYLKYEIASGEVTEVTADEILQWFVACFETQGNVWTEMNRKTFFFGSRERVYANEKSVKELRASVFPWGAVLRSFERTVGSGRISGAPREMQATELPHRKCPTMCCHNLRPFDLGRFPRLLFHGHMASTIQRAEAKSCKGVTLLGNTLAPEDGMFLVRFGSVSSGPSQ